MNPPRAAPALIMLLCAVLAGCTEESSPTTALPAIQWEPMDVNTTAIEPWEYRGYVRVAWPADMFALDVEVEPDLPPRLVHDGQDLYTSRTGTGWTHLPLSEAPGTLSNRVALWDLRALTTAPGLDTAVQEDGQTIIIRLDGQLSWDGELEVHATIHVEGGRVTWAEVDSPQGREAPYTLRPAADAFSYEPQVPSDARTAAQIMQGDADARKAHVQIIGLIRDHLERRGTLPERIDPDSLRLELAISGEPWPTNPYDGSPVQAGTTSGDLHWKRCTATTGVYQGLGWDIALVGEAYGKGCGFGPA